MPGVPYIFATATTSIPLSELDVNFATNATLGNATVGLGNTTTTVGNLTLTNVTVSSGNVTATNVTATNVTSPASTALTLQSNAGNTAVTIDTSQNVGIGTTSPAAKLDVRGSSTFLVNATNPTAWVSVDSGLTTGSIYNQWNTTSSIGITGTYTNHPYTFVTNNAERMRIDTSGNVGIGTSSPSTYGKLTVQGTSGSSQFWGGSAAGNGVFIDAYDSSTIYMLAVATNSTSFALGSQSNIPTTFFTNNTEKGRFDTSGNLLVGYTSSNGSYKLQVNSQIFATSSTIATSDANYKTNVTPLTGALTLVNKLNPVSFNWKKHAVHDFDTKNVTVGFLAQEVQTALSETNFVNSIVKESVCTITNEVKDEAGNVITPAVTETFLGIAEGNMISILTKAIQELSAQVTTLQSQVAALTPKS